MNQPLVSVIVPCYNYGRFIAETLKSLQNQTLQNWECVVVDDGSTDNSAEVVQKFVESDPRVRYVYQQNQGLPAARNTGIRATTGKYIQFLDSDDLLQSDKLQHHTAYLEAHAEVELVYGGLRYFYDGTSELIFSPQHKSTPWTLDKSGAGIALLPFLVISCVIMPPMPVMRRTTIEKVTGLFTEDLPSCEDWEFWIRCCYKNVQFTYLDLPNTLPLMRLHHTSMTRNRIVMVNSFIEVRQRLRPILPTPQLVKLNETLLNNDFVEKCILTLEREGRMAAIREAFYLSIERKSCILLGWSVLLFALPPTWAVKLLQLQRSFHKRFYHWVFKK